MKNQTKLVDATSLLCTPDPLTALLFMSPLLFPLSLSIPSPPLPYRTLVFSHSLKMLELLSVCLTHRSPYSTSSHTLVTHVTITHKLTLRLNAGVNSLTHFEGKP